LVHNARPADIGADHAGGSMIATPHRDAPVRCTVCDRTVQRRSREQVYCSPKCMRKANYARKAGSGLLLGQDTTLVRNPHKIPNENNVLQWPKRGASLSFNAPLNLLGGGSWRWPEAKRLDSKTLANIRWSEVGGDVVLPEDEP
jgi:hypothetical protein